MRLLLVGANIDSWCLTACTSCCQAPAAAVAGTPAAAAASHVMLLPLLLSFLPNSCFLVLCHNTVNGLLPASLTLAAEPLRDLSSQPVGLLHSTQPTQTSSEQLKWVSGHFYAGCWVMLQEHCSTDITLMHIWVKPLRDLPSWPPAGRAG